MKARPPTDMHSVESCGEAVQGASNSLLAPVLRALRTARGGRITTYRDRYRIAVVFSLLPFRLEWLLHIFGSDKQEKGEHTYGPTYHTLMHPFRYKRIKLLEIGILSGASLLAWRAFFPRGTIIGCDIERKDHFSIGRIITCLADQSSDSDLATLCARFGPFDVMIDDGSHQNSHQIFTFYTMFDSLTDQGIYIIEDVQTSFWPGPYGGFPIDSPAFAQTCVGEFLELSKYLNHNEFFSTQDLDVKRLSFAKRIKSITFEHNLIIVKKGENDEDSNSQDLAKANAIQ